MVIDESKTAGEFGLMQMIGRPSTC